LTPSEFEKLFKYFDKKVDGYVVYSDLINTLSGDLQGKRLAAVNAVWNRIAPNGSATKEELFAKYDSSVFRNVTKAEAWERFSASFDTDKDSKVNEASFKDCYT
jgi:Ca2+-binding EF-hand superfamily protein